MEQPAKDVRPHGGAQVVLVGAGPGDPGLMTLAGKEAIERADVLVYDRLVSPRLVGYAPAGCELVYVGKTPERHTLPQDRINALLVERARAGKLVVRLKGGDPFVFGRGGEEAEALEEHGIPFAIVPGVTSALAAPAYAGIPLTHRAMASSFTVITGHERPDKLASSIDWEHTAKLQGTLVFLMGMKNLPLIAQNLIAHGKAPDTPAAVVERGTWPAQRVLISTLADVAGEVAARGFANPAVVVVGEVVSLHERLAWFAPGPLGGRTVVVTRARGQASALARLLEERGAAVEEYPMIKIAPPTDPEALVRAAHAFPWFDWTVFTSANGVEAFFAALDEAGCDAAGFAGVRAVAVGPGTQRALRQRGVPTVLVPDEFRSEGAEAVLREHVHPGDRVLLIRAEQARAVLPEAIASLGAELIDVPAYRSVPVEDGRASLVEGLRAGRIDAITFASSSTVRNLVALLGRDAVLLDGPALFSIGPVTTETMRECGLALAGQADPCTIEGLADVVCRTLGGTP